MRRPSLFTDPWLSALSEESRRFIDERARRRSVRHRGTVYATGDDADGLSCVISGEIRLLSYPAPGRQLLVLVAGPGDWFGELSVLDQGPRPHDAICHGQTTVLHLSMQNIATLADSAPNFYRDVALIACQHQRAALAYINDLLVKPSKARLAELILDLLPDYEGDRAAAGGVVEIRQEDLADRIGVSRQHLNVLLAEIQRTGSIRTAYGRIHVTDCHRLEVLAA